MVWGPNLAVNYPFQNGGVPLPNVGSINFNLLDTNKDGVIDLKDDPYTPYYPGDEYVDWVGLSLYWYPTGGINNLPDPTYFADQLTATGNRKSLTLGPSVARYQPSVLNQANRNFYQNFCVNRGKPLVIPETSAPWIPSWTKGDGDENQIKTNWYNQIFSDETMRRFPKLKGAVWFEEFKSDGMEMRDWRLMSSPTVLNSYKTLLKDRITKKKLAGAANLEVNCAGTVNAKF